MESYERVDLPPRWSPMEVEIAVLLSLGTHSTHSLEQKPETMKQRAWRPWKAWIAGLALSDWCCDVVARSKGQQILIPCDQVRVIHLAGTTTLVEGLTCCVVATVAPELRPFMTLGKLFKRSSMNELYSKIAGDSKADAPTLGTRLDKASPMRQHLLNEVNVRVNPLL